MYRVAVACTTEMAANKLGPPRVSVMPPPPDRQIPGVSPGTKWAASQARPAIVRKSQGPVRSSANVRVAVTVISQSPGPQAPAEFVIRIPPEYHASVDRQRTKIVLHRGTASSSPNARQPGRHTVTGTSKPPALNVNKCGMTARQPDRQRHRQGLPSSLNNAPSHRPPVAVTCNLAGCNNCHQMSGRSQQLKLPNARVPSNGFLTASCQ